MNNATMFATVPAAPVAERPSVQKAPKPAASLVGFIVVGGRTVPMMADHSLDTISISSAVLALQMEDPGMLE